MAALLALLLMGLGGVLFVRGGALPRLPGMEVSLPGATIVGAALMRTGLLFAAISLGAVLYQRHAARLSKLSQASGTRLIIGISLGALLLVMLTTPRIEFGQGKAGVGYGHDGVNYGKIADHFGEDDLRVARPFSYRVFPAVLVHYLPLSTLDGFLLVNVVCFALSCGLLFALLRAHGIDPGPAAVGVLLFAALKFGVKFWVYYPATTDAMGTCFLLAILLSVVRGWQMVYLLCMVAGVLCRENLIVLIGFHVLYQFRDKRMAKATVLPVFLNALPLAMLLWQWKHPWVTPSDAAAPSLLTSVLGWGGLFAHDPVRQLQVFFGLINSLGVLAVLPLIMPADSWRWLRSRLHWLYFLAVHLFLCVVGGVDADRFAVWLAPGLIVLACCLYRKRLQGASLTQRVQATHRAAWLLVFLHVAWSEVLLPWRSDEAFYLHRYATHSPGYGFALIQWPALLLAAMALVVVVNGRSHGQDVSGPALERRIDEG